MWVITATALASYRNDHKYFLWSLGLTSWGIPLMNGSVLHTYAYLFGPAQREEAKSLAYRQRTAAWVGWGYISALGLKSGSQLLDLVCSVILNVDIPYPLPLVPSDREPWTGEEPQCALVWLLIRHLHGSKVGHPPPNLNMTLVASPKTCQEHPAVPRGELAQNYYSCV